MRWDIRRTVRRWTLDLLLHRRMVLFWTLALTGAAAPWMLDLQHAEAAGRAPTSADSAAGEHQTCTVDHLHDGDTATLRCNFAEVKVRFYCIDAPEIAQAPWGERSRDHLGELIGGEWRERRGNLYPTTRTTVALRAVERDRYGRTVGELFTLKGESLNLALVRDGQAAVYERYCKDAAFKPAQAEARKARRGVWSRPGEQQRPWEWRHE